MIYKAALLLETSSKKCILLLLVSIAMILSGRAEGMAASDIEIQLYMSTELNNIPAYCQTKLAEVYFEKEYPPSERNNIKWPPLFSKYLNKYRNAIGQQNWIYFHHYCFGIKDYVTYNAKKSNISITKQNNYKNEMCKRALGQFEFMRKANTLNFPLWRELYTYEALIYSELGNPEKAIWATQQSRRYKPFRLN